MNAYAGLAEALNTVPEDQLLDLPDRSEFRLCGVATGITKKLSKKDNRPWAAFTLATKSVPLPMNMFSDAYEDYARHLVTEAPVLVQGNLLAGNDGVRINVSSGKSPGCCIPTIPNCPIFSASCARRWMQTTATPVSSLPLCSKIASLPSPTPRPAWAGS